MTDRAQATVPHAGDFQVNSDDMLRTQRALRGRLLDSQTAVMPGASDLAAHLLLYLDDTERCWQLTLDWLRHSLDADRVDGGFADSDMINYQPLAESVRGDLHMPTSVGAVFDAREAAMRSVWASPHAVVFGNVAEDARFTPQTRAQLLTLNTHAKLGLSLREDGRPIGLICCDWTREQRSWSADLCRQISNVANAILAPIFSAAHHGAREREESAEAPAGAGVLASLTRGELQVARLVVTGMSYKEIASQLNRSFSTVDHRLRSIRDKLGARSTARMIATLSEALGKS